MIIPDIPQEPIIVKNSWICNGGGKYRPDCDTIPFYIDYIADGCVEGWDDTNNELFMHNLDDMVKTNHNYKHYKRKKKVIFPWRECAYTGYLVKEEKDISECIVEEYNIMFRVPTNLLIDYDLFLKQPDIKHKNIGHWNADGTKYFKWNENSIVKGKIINFYKENGEMKYIVLSSPHGYFTKLTKKDIISMSTYHKVNSYYRYGEDNDNVTKFS